MRPVPTFEGEGNQAPRAGSRLELLPLLESAGVSPSSQRVSVRGGPGEGGF